MRFDPYWFCVTPEAFIFSHLPENNEWQLTSQIITLKQYENLPFLNECIFKLGFNAQDIFLKGVSGDLKEFVKTFPTSYPINAGHLPVAKEITRGKAYTFSIESEYLENVMLRDGAQWIEMKKEGNRFKIEYAPKEDKLKVLAKANWYDKNYETIAVYDIVDDENLTATL